MDKSGANKTAIDVINTHRDVPIGVRQVKSGEMRPVI